MQGKLMAAILAIDLAIFLTPAFAAAPEDQTPIFASSMSAMSASNATSAPEASGLPAELRLSSPFDYPYYGFCSQTCQDCEAYGSGLFNNSCPPDPLTGLRQSCTRTRSC